jgi:hypothetical protein
MKNTISLKLNGEITLSTFAKAMNHFTDLIDELTNEVGEKAEIEWEINKLESGSATAVIIGRSHNEFAVEKIIQAYEVIGRSITENKPIPYNEKIANATRAITQVINGKVKSVEFGTEDYQTVINKSLVDQMPEEKEFSFGTVTGRVETLSKHGRMRFVLYDKLFDKAVTCYLAENQEKLLLDAWDKDITVAGKVYRDFTTGRPYQVRDVNYVEKKKKSPPGSFMKAQGIIPWKEGEEKPEEIIRRFRDGR